MTAFPANANLSVELPSEVQLRGKLHLNKSGGRGMKVDNVEIKKGPTQIPLFSRLYYRCKRFIPKSVRLELRKLHARRVLSTVGSNWPICEAAGEKPAGWPGWPEGKQFAFVLTHDVESLRGLERVKQLAELEMDLGFRSSFNFIPEGGYEVPASLRNWLVERGFEVGVHDLYHDGALYSSRASFRSKAQQVNRYLTEWNAVGFRSGFMLHNLEWASDLNVLYEASTFDTDPFEPQPDGVHTIFPFWVPLPLDSQNNGCRSGYVELPYTLPQDSTLFVYLGQRTADLWKRKLDWIAAREGMALMIVHPDYTKFGGPAVGDDEFPVAHYIEFLNYVRERYAGAFWHALPKDVASYVVDSRAKQSAASVSAGQMLDCVSSKA